MWVLRQKNTSDLSRCLPCLCFYERTQPSGGGRISESTQNTRRTIAFRANLCGIRRDTNKVCSDAAAACKMEAPPPQPHSAPGHACQRDRSRNRPIAPTAAQNKQNTTSIGEPSHKLHIVNERKLAAQSATELRQQCLCPDYESKVLGVGGRVEVKTHITRT